MIDVLQLVRLRPEVQKELEARYRLHGKGDFDKVAAIVRGCVTTGHSGPPPEMIDRMPKLEIIASASVGYDGIPVEYARSKGIPVTNTPEVLNDDVADLAIALMIMTARRLVASDAYVRAGKWPKGGEYPLAQKASRKRVGILGMGRIGKEIAKRAEAMNNTVAYHSRRPVADVSYKHYPDLVELARNSDFLVVIIPSTPQTHKIVNKAVIEVGGCDGVYEEGEDRAEESADGSWNEGGVASGSVVNRIPVETPALRSLALKYTSAPADIRPFKPPSIASSSSTRFCLEPANADC